MEMNFRRFFGTAAFLFLVSVANPVSAQIITNVTPPLGAHGDLVKILGNGFAPGGVRPSTLTVDFNGTLSTSSPNAVVSDSEIDITNVPTTASSGYIHAFVNGSEATSPQQFIVISTNAYVTNFTPVYGAQNTTVVLTGVHFSTGGATNVMFNGVLSKKTAGTPFLKSDNEMDVTAPSGVTTGPLVLMSKFGPTHNFSTVSNVISITTNFFVAPSLTSFSPATGRPNTNVVIKGTNFIAASAVQFGSVNATDFTVMDNNTIQATVPTNASTAAITVSPPSGTILSAAQSATSFKMLPTIYNFFPSSGPTNTLITISGAGLNEKAPHPDVTVGGGTVTTFGTISVNTLSFNVPTTASSGVITITTTNGSITSTQLFYLPASISSFTPIGGAAGTIVRINGNNFTNASAVSFNGIPATAFAVTNNTTLGAVAPAGVTSGVISVTTPFGATNSIALFYAPPTVISFTPTHGLPGTNVTITGTSFTNATAVLFNGTPAASFTVTNNNILSAVVPNDVTSGPITVAAPGGTNSSATDFTVDSTDIGVTVTALPDPVFIGSNLVYTIIVTNGGPVQALNVRLTNTLPQSVVLKSAATTQGSLTTNVSPIVGALGNLNSSNSATILLTVTPTVAGLITNTASIGSDSLDPNPANNIYSIATTVWPLPLLSITNLMSNNLVQISWPAPLSSFTLQFNTGLSANLVWTNDPAMKTMNGTNVSVIETNIGAARFFRLTN
jgi:hypothetical protein